MPMFWEARPEDARAMRSWARASSEERSGEENVVDVLVVVVILVGVSTMSD